MKHLLLLSAAAAFAPLMFNAPDTGGVSSPIPPAGTPVFTPANRPKDDDYSPQAMQFRDDHPDLYPVNEKKEKEEKEEKDDKGTDGHKPHAVFSESEPPQVPEEQDNTPAPTHFAHLQ